MKELSKRFHDKPQDSIKFNLDNGQNVSTEANEVK